MAGIDKYTKLLIRGDGVDTSTDIVDSSPSGHSFTANGDAQIDTAQSVFGGSSILFDGSDSVSTPTHADFNFRDTTGDSFTVDFHIRFNTTGVHGIMGQYDNGSDFWGIKVSGGNIFIYSINAAVQKLWFQCAFTPVADTWYHLAFVYDGDGTQAYIFIDGVSQTITGGNDLAWGSGFSGPLYLGYYQDTPNYLDGWLDEVRFSVGIARWVSNFTPDTEAYTANPVIGIDADNVLMIHTTGLDATTVFTDSSDSAHTVTAEGNAQIDTAQGKFDNPAALFDGATNTRLRVPDHIDLDFASEDFTIDFWFRINDWQSGDKLLAGKWDIGGYAPWLFSHNSSNIVFFADSGAESWDVALTRTVATGLVLNKWHHFACTREGSNYYFFLDGVQTDTFTNGSGSGDWSEDVVIGGGTTGWYMKGHIAEFRLAKGMARWIDDFTPPMGEYVIDAEYGIDSDTKLMIHADETGAAFVDSSDESHTITPVGDATQDAAASKFGGKGLLLDGTGDWITAPDSEDWDFGNDDFTVEGWFKGSEQSGKSGTVIGVGTDAVAWSTIGWFIRLDGTDTGQTGQLLAQMSDDGASGITLYSGDTYDDNIFHHVALIRYGNIFTLYVDGLPKAVMELDLTCLNMTEPLKVGNMGGNNEPFAGGLDELRVSKGIARWIGGFTPPVLAYERDPGIPVELVIQGPALVEDSWLQQDAPTANQGSNVAGIVRARSSSRSIRTIVSFDFSSIPVDATIISASFEIYKYSFMDADPVGRTYEAYRITETGWVEAEVTWNNYNTGNAWVTGGGDYTVTDMVSDVVPAGADWMVYDVMAQVVAAISEAVDVAHILLKDSLESQDPTKSALFHLTEEATFTTLRPKLTIVYTTSEPEPPGPTVDPEEAAFLTKAGVPGKWRQRQPVNQGFSVTPGMEVPVSIKMDKWFSVFTPPVRGKPRNVANVTQIRYVDFSVPTLPIIYVDKWLSQFDKPRRKKRIVNPTEFSISFIEALNPVNGNYWDSGVVGIQITEEGDESQTYADYETVSFTITGDHVEDFQLEEHETISFTIKTPEVGIEAFNIGVPGYAGVNVTINGVNQSGFITGAVNVIREDNTAARFRLSLERDPDALIPTKPVEFINKVVAISFAAADMDGLVADYIPVFVGMIKGVSLNTDIGTLNISGYDYGGIHQTRGEYISQNITTVLTGAVYGNSATVLSTGHSPIWGVIWGGNAEVEDGQDYFVDTQNGTITIPISSRILQFPGSFTYSYSDPMASMSAIIEAVVGIKGWGITEDNVAIADYTDTDAHPVLSLSDESVIDTCRKFLECSGAKVESNLYPDLRVYSEVENWIGPINTVNVDESIIFEKSLVINIDFDNLLNEQTVRTVQKVNAAIEISGSTILATFQGSQNTINPFTIQGGSNINGIDYQTPSVLVEVRLRKQNINSLSFVSSGTFKLNYFYNSYSEPITGASWAYHVDGDDFVITLSHNVVTAGGNPGGTSFSSGFSTVHAFPAVDYSLTVYGTKIGYGGTTEDVRVVTAERPVSGISDTLKGDVYENAYTETDTHCVNICNAILLEHGNPYTVRFEMPIFEGKSAQIGDKLNILRDEGIIFSGIIKTLGYTINVKTGANVLAVRAKGIGRGI